MLVNKVSSSISENLAKLEDVISKSSDLVYLDWSFGPEYTISACSVYYQSLTQMKNINYMRASLQDLVDHELGNGTEVTLKDLTVFFENGGVSSQIAKPVCDFDQVVHRILNGFVVIFIEQWDVALTYNASSVETRAIMEPTIEAVVQGPRESTVEDLLKNQGLIRRRLKSRNLQMISIQAGGETHTEVVYAYLRGTVAEETLTEFKQRIERVSDMEVLETAYIAELVEDHTYSPFPQCRITERPDVAVANLLKGKIIVMVEGTGTILICPGLLTEFFQSSEDYYQRTVISTLIRLLRVVAFFIALALPSMYIALTTFHSELLPTVLLLAIIDAREGIPLPAFFEALIMEFFFELLREAGVRLPRPIGSAVSIVGALVIGEAAITAGIASPIMIVIVALTGIASFAIPQYNMAISLRVLRFPLMLISSTLGGFGLMFGILLISLHLCSLRSLGQPFLSPLAPLRMSQLRDIFVRAPLGTLMHSLRSRPRKAKKYR